ncbi:MAG TPA: IlvD/Edd family dehydratase [Methylomirabilota bacterium]|jgi:dihydroxy-acid dehydratase|nr:IlvD/Edd family dehydratase [Methylomirabilota bacterium]
MATQRPPDAAAGIRRGLTHYGDAEFSLFVRGAYARGGGLTSEDLARPVIGLAQTWSEFNPCHRHLREVAEAVKRGVWQAGGLPLEFPTISLGEIFLSPTSMLFRNLMAMDTEEMILGQPMDGVVLLGGCDKTLPAQLMGAASADRPAIVVTAGPMLTGRHEGARLGACTDCRGLWAEHRAGRLDAARLEAIQGELFPSAGTCMVMGTASTMAALTEALGMTLPGMAAVPAPLARRLRLAEAAGRRIVAMVREDLRPSRILTPPAFENAVRVLMALGGSTNAVVHLTAIAGRAGVALTLDDFERLSRSTPMIADVRPSGAHHMEDLAEAGGIPAVMKVLAPLLHADAATATGQPLAAVLDGIPPPGAWQDVVRPLERPLRPEGGLAILRGSLAPDGAVLKVSAATPALLRHRGRACVFRDLGDLAARVDDPALPVTADSVLVLQNAGPVGGPGMPEAGSLPIPRKLLAAGVADMVRVSDARMSGTAGGTVVLHVAPEAAVGGPLALVRDGDLIELDAPARRLDLLVPPEELARRRAAWRPPAPAPGRGYRRLFVERVLQAPAGCDFDFLVADAGRPAAS